MQNLFIVIFILLSPINRADTALNPEKLIIKKNIKKAILAGKVYSKSIVKDLNDKKTQELTFFVTGLHPKSCQVALSKISQYERYKEFLDMVLASLYNEKKKEIYLILGHLILPYKMTLKFILPRIKSTGVYPFTFTNGFLKGLSGKINVSDYKNKCFFYTQAYWKGPHSQINSTIFQMFSSTLSKMAMERIFQISRTY